MMNSTINTDNVSASVEVPTLDATLSANTLIGQSSTNNMTASTTANALIGSIGNGVIVSGIRSIYVNNIEQQVIGDTAYISLSYNILTDKPTIPTKTSDLINDSGFINSGYVTTNEFTSLSNQVGTIENNITNVNSDIEEINEEIEEINETLTNKVNQTDFNNLQSQVTTNTTNIATNTTNIATNTNNITTLTNITDAQSATIASMSSLIEDNSDAIGTLSNLTTTDKTNLVSAINEVKGDIPEYVSDLSNDLGFITNTDYAGTSTGGVIKVGTYESAVNSSGVLYANALTYADYGTASDNIFISKGTLENVITGKNLVTTTSYANSATAGVIKTSTTYNYFASSGILNASINTYATYISKSNNAFISKGTLENVITGKGLVNSTQLATKQDTLVSGTNIKTINNQSLLGSGDITISGGQATDVQINGTSITSSNVADIQTNGTYNSSSNKIATMSDIPSVPTAVSQLTNDAGYITNTVNDLTNYTLSSNLATVATTGAYSDLSGTPTVPTATSQLTNDSGYVTNTDYANSTTGGVVKTGSYGFNIGGAGVPYPSTSNYATYLTLPDYHFIGKGTLENVLTGKGFVTASDIFYKSGDTYTTSTVLVATGYITGSTKSITFNLPLPKRMDNISSITYNTFNIVGRSNSGYLNNTGSYFSVLGSDYTIATGIEPNVISLTITKNTAFTNITNNTPVAIQIQGGFSITFN